MNHLQREKMEKFYDNCDEKQLAEQLSQNIFYQELYDAEIAAARASMSLLRLKVEEHKKVQENLREEYAYIRACQNTLKSYKDNVRAQNVDNQITEESGNIV